MEQKQRGNLKILSGIVLMLAGGLGILFGRSIKQRALRITVLILSVLSLGSGFYLFVDGVEDRAIGSVGHYLIGGPEFQEYIYPSREDLIKGLELTFKHKPDLRRLQYRCPGGRVAVTIYNTPFGLLGVPKHPVGCGDKVLIGFVE